jgi:hypothetical protein
MDLVPISVLKIKGSSNFRFNMQNMKFFTMNFVKELFQDKNNITKF